MNLSKLGLLRRAEWRNYYFWLHAAKKMPRKIKGCFPVEGKTVEYGDWAAFLGAYADIFGYQIYDFTPKTDAPVILDVGANIGLATIWWKLHYPSAKVIAIEADPVIFGMLSANVRRFGFDDVELINAAAWTCDGTLRFMPDGSDGGRVSDEGIEVRALKLASLIDRFERVSFLKLDIEGGERDVVPTLGNSLSKVDNFFCEYHSAVGSPQLLEAVLSPIVHAGFRYHIKNLLASDRPFLHIDESCGFDNQLNIFCTR